MALIAWHFDLVSPFAQIALPRVEALAREHAVQCRPVLLSALLQHWGQLGPAEIAPKRLHTYRLSQFMAGAAGVKLRYPPRHPFRSLEALRLLAALDSPAEAVRTAFDFVWAEGRDPGDPGELAALADRLGVRDPGGFAADRDAKAKLRANTDAAIAAGVFGVPTLQVGGELFWGVDALPMAEAYVRDPALFARDEMARLAALPVGVARNPGSLRANITPS